MVIKCKLHKAGARAEIYFHEKLKMGVLAGQKPPTSVKMKLEKEVYKLYKLPSSRISYHQVPLVVNDIPRIVRVLLFHYATFF